MKAFECDHCGNLVFFENVTCLRCHRALGFLPEFIDLSTLEPVGTLTWKPRAPAANETLYRQCQNARDYQACNWMVHSDDPNPLCRACRLNLIIPDLSVGNHLQLWQKLELAKRRVMYSLLRLHLSTENDGQRPSLRFRFMADLEHGSRILTGHSEGVITINLAEADDAVRERRRLELHEPYRTLLGHVRHEVAHYFWDRLVARSPHLERFRELFGDDRKNYAEGLQCHYDLGPPADWQRFYVSAYASCHPWEDWAETFAHYLHVFDTLETAGSFGLSLRPRHAQADTMRADPKMLDFSDFNEIIANWLPLTYALNELNRGMGLPELYPFVLSEWSLEKLRFVHSVLRST